MFEAFSNNTDNGVPTKGDMIQLLLAVSSNVLDNIRVHQIDGAVNATDANEQLSVTDESLDLVETIQTNTKLLIKYSQATEISTSSYGYFRKSRKSILI